MTYKYAIYSKKIFEDPFEILHCETGRDKIKILQKLLGLTNLLIKM